MGKTVRLIACFGWQAAWWLAWFLLCGVALSLAERPVWLAIPVGLAAGGLHAVLFSRRRLPAPAAGTQPRPAPLPQDEEDETVAAVLQHFDRSGENVSRLRRARKTVWCAAIGRDPDAVAAFAKDVRVEDAVVRHIALPFAWRRRDEARWRTLLARISAVPGEKRVLCGVIVHLSAQWIAEGEEDALVKKARLLRRRLRDLARITGERPAVFILVDGLDRLYGWRSALGLLSKERVLQPLGGSRGEDESIDSLIDAATAEATLLSLSSGAPLSAAAPARLQAGPEFRRVADRLRFFARQLLAPENGGDPSPHGMFFGSTLPGLPALPPFAAAASFVPEEEPPCRQPSLFFARLFDAVIPETLWRRANAKHAKAWRRRGMLFHSAAAGIMATALVLGWLMTWSFTETRGILLSAAGETAYPEAPEQLAGYLHLAETTAARSDRLTLPRFGMAEDKQLAGELRRRFSESYFDLKTVPGIDRLQNAALAAVRSGDAKELGNALVMLVLTGDGIASALGQPRLSDEQRAFLGAVAVSLDLTSQDEMRQLRKFFDWAGQRDWMPKTRDALLRFERHIVDSDRLGEWLPRWVDSVPLLEDAPVEGVAGENVVPPAWTWRGYAVARELAAAVTPAEEDSGAEAAPPWRSAALEEYRKNALAAWRGVAAALWDGFPNAVPDAEIPARLRLVAEGDDPAFRIIHRAGENLLPMFASRDEPSASAPPEILWLRLRLAMASPSSQPNPDTDTETGVRLFAAIRQALADSAADRSFDPLAAHFRAWETRKETLNDPRNPIAEASRLARELTAFLNDRAGASVWPTLSPLAVDTYTRHLLSRQAAFALGDIWLRTVYTPCQLTPGGPDSQRDRLAKAGGLLEQFLTGPADGFWTWRGDSIDNARWNGVAFTFSRDFLAFCNAALADSRLPALNELPLTLDVSSVNVSGPKVVERPVAVEFRLGTEKTGTTIRYRNYPVSGDWLWTPAVDEAEIKLVFPSHTAAMTFTGQDELKKFYTLFGEGSCFLTPESFGPSAPILRRLGLAEITITATLTNLPQLIPYLSRPRQAPLPRNIISERGESGRREGSK